MLVKIRENIFVGDAKVTDTELIKNGVNMILVVGGDIPKKLNGEYISFYVSLQTDKVNKPHVKDIACHIPKYMIQNGETIAIISENGLIRAPFVACRAICEIENKSIYDVFAEVEEKKLIKGFDLGKAYL